MLIIKLTNWKIWRNCHRLLEITVLQSKICIGFDVDRFGIKFMHIIFIKYSLKEKNYQRNYIK